MGCGGSGGGGSPVQRFASSLAIRPWNVVGLDLQNKQEGLEPDGDTLIVVASSLDDLRSPQVQLGQLAGVSGHVCRWLGIAEDKSFPSQVLAEVQKDGDVAYHRYGYPTSKHVLHVAAPVLGASKSEKDAKLGVSVQSEHQLGVYDTMLFLAAGTVVDFEGDAIVNAANEGCLFGAGVDDAIVLAGGKPLAEARQALPVLGKMRRGGAPGDVRCPTGEAKITIGGNLRAKWCIHAVGPNYGLEASLKDGSGKTEKECDALVQQTYCNALKCAEEKGLTTVAFPLICGGTFRGKRPLKTILELALEGIKKGAYAGLREVYWVAFTNEELAELRQTAAALPTPPGDDSKSVVAAAVSKLAGSYKKILTLASQIGKPKVRLSPISDEAAAGQHANQLPELTVEGLLKGFQQLSPEEVRSLSKSMEFCTGSQPASIRYERALRGSDTMSGKGSG